MAAAAQDAALALLPLSLASTAIDLTASANVFEYAFPLHHAPEILARLIEVDIYPLGGDLWLRDEKGFAAGGANWSVDPAATQDTQSRATATRLAMDKFMRQCEVIEDDCWATFVV